MIEKNCNEITLEYIDSISRIIHFSGETSIFYFFNRIKVKIFLKSCVWLQIDNIEACLQFLHQLGVNLDGITANGMSYVDIKS